MRRLCVNNDLMINGITGDVNRIGQAQAQGTGYTDTNRWVSARHRIHNQAQQRAGQCMASCALCSDLEPGRKRTQRKQIKTNHRIRRSSFKILMMSHLAFICLSIWLPVHVVAYRHLVIWRTFLVPVRQVRRQHFVFVDFSLNLRVPSPERTATHNELRENTEFYDEIRWRHEVNRFRMIDSIFGFIFSVI